jgi:hypothetical protein
VALQLNSLTRVDEEGSHSRQAEPDGAQDYPTPWMHDALTKCALECEATFEAVALRGPNEQQQIGTANGYRRVTSGHFLVAAAVPFAPIQEQASQGIRISVRIGTARIS